MRQGSRIRCSENAGVLTGSAIVALPFLTPRLRSASWRPLAIRSLPCPCQRGDSERGRARGHALGEECETSADKSGLLAGCRSTGRARVCDRGTTLPVDHRPHQKASPRASLCSAGLGVEADLFDFLNLNNASVVDHDLDLAKSKRPDLLSNLLQPGGNLRIG